jgi:hypothetical protein
LHQSDFELSSRVLTQGSGSELFEHFVERVEFSSMELDESFETEGWPSWKAFLDAGEESLGFVGSPGGEESVT